MKLRFCRNRRGMLLMTIIGILAVVFIIFISMVDRVRHEGAMTNRVAINERLYQTASAIGRLAVRKLEKNFSARRPDDENSSDWTFGDKLFTEPDKPLVSDGDKFKKQIESHKIIKDIKKEYELVWGNKDGKLEIDDISYEIKLEDKFEPQYNGFVGEDENKEGKGTVKVNVVVSHKGVRKKITVTKEFYLVRLLPGPFYRFTLFSQKGAEIANESGGTDKANRLVCEASGKYKEEDGYKQPLVCINRITTSTNGSSDPSFNYNSGVYNSGDPLKNGWIYLGGEPRGQNSKGEKALMLNITAGFGGDINEKFGEMFHFYYNTDSQGWVKFNQFSQHINKPSDSIDVQMASVDYGFYKDIPTMKVNDYELFKNSLAPAVYKGTSDNKWKASSLHLYGTTQHCTPTVVFGNVVRRYLRVYGFLFTLNGATRVYPIAAKSKRALIDDVFRPNEADPNTPASRNIFSTWLVPKFGISNDVIDTFSKAYDDFAKPFSKNILNNGNPISSRDIIPQVYDFESYNRGLKNLCKPGSPDSTWNDALTSKSSSTLVDLLGNPDNLTNSPRDPNFNFDENNTGKPVHYSGPISEIIASADIKGSYLKDRVTYKIGNGESNINLLDETNNKFFVDKFVFKDDETGEDCLWLNQIVEFNCKKLTIDKPISIRKGGIIIAPEIDIKAKITNHDLENNATGPDAFGWLTLIARKGDINIKGVLKTYAILIANGNVTSDARCQIVGSVTSNSISSLVEKGCFIQWGFHPEEIADNNNWNKDLTERSYYGLAYGPRDVEISISN